MILKKPARALLIGDATDEKKLGLEIGKYRCKIQNKKKKQKKPTTCTLIYNYVNYI